MNLPPRQQQILELVRERGYVSIEEMATLFVVTPQTIRRDINQLAEANLLRRYHGGAAYDSSVENTAYAMRADQMRDEKQRRPGVAMELEEGYYRLLVRITETHWQRNGLRLQPLPGMTATVEIKTGQKSVLEYLFRPLQNVTQALRER